MERLTPWYLPEVLPVRSGVYEVELPIYVGSEEAALLPPWFARFDAQDATWYAPVAYTPDGCAPLGRGVPCIHQAWAWRGLYGPEGA